MAKEPETDNEELQQSRIEHEAASEQRYRLLVENTGRAIVVAQEGVLKFVNPMSAKMFGYPAEALLSTPFTEFVHPDDRENVMEKYSILLHHGAAPDRYSIRVTGLRDAFPHRLPAPGPGNTLLPPRKMGRHGLSPST